MIISVAKPFNYTTQHTRDCVVVHGSIKGLCAVDMFIQIAQISWGDCSQTRSFGIPVMIIIATILSAGIAIRDKSRLRSETERNWSVNYTERSRKGFVLAYPSIEGFHLCHDRYRGKEGRIPGELASIACQCFTTWPRIHIVGGRKDG